MGINRKSTKGDEAQQLHQIANGVRTWFTMTNVNVGGSSYTPTALAQKVDDFGNNIAAVQQEAVNLKNSRANLSL